MSLSGEQGNSMTWTFYSLDPNPSLPVEANFERDSQNIFQRSLKSGQVPLSGKQGNKAQYQLCKRVAGLAQSTAIFLCIRPFSAWWQPNERPHNRVTLVRACSWPARRKSFTIAIHEPNPVCWSELWTCQLSNVDCGRKKIPLSAFLSYFSLALHWTSKQAPV